MGYALLLNKEQPLAAATMVSHGWGEDFGQIVSAITEWCDSGGTGPVWVCATSLYQNEDIDGLKIKINWGRIWIQARSQLRSQLY